MIKSEYHFRFDKGNGHLTDNLDLLARIVAYYPCRIPTLISQTYAIETLRLYVLEARQPSNFEYFDKPIYTFVSVAYHSLSALSMLVKNPLFNSLSKPGH